MLVSGGSAELKKNGASLAKDARIIFEKLVLNDAIARRIVDLILLVITKSLKN